MFPSLASHINSLFLSSTGPTDKVGCKKSHEGVLPILISNEKVASSKIPPEFHLFWSLFLGTFDFRTRSPNRPQQNSFFFSAIFFFHP